MCHSVFCSKSLKTDLGDGKETDPRENDESHGIEPAPNVGQEPERDSELDRVQHVLNLKR